jgi:hypothetical protein
MNADDDNDWPACLTPHLRIVSLTIVKCMYRVRISNGEIFGPFHATCQGDAIKQCLARVGYASVDAAYKDGYELIAERIYD